MDITENKKLDPEMRYFRLFAIKYEDDKSRVFETTKKYKNNWLPSL